MEILYQKQFTLDTIDAVAAEIAARIRPGEVLCFTGDLGAGKTTLIKSICAHLGVEDEVTSPTFSIINEYETKSGQTVFHMDLYRLETPESALEIGIPDYLSSGETCLIEWPERISPFLYKGMMDIHLTVIDEWRRQVVLSK